MLERIAEILWGPATIIIIVGIGIYLNVRSRFFPFAKIGKIAKNTILKKHTGDGVSPFAALATALSGCIGVGNIVGVAAAISIGGAGAVFWMWVCALITMIIKFAEVSLAMRYRKSVNGEYFGGPMYYLRDGAGLGRLGTVYAICGFASAIGVGTIVQSNTVSATLDSFFGISPAVCAVILAIFAGVLLLGKSGLVFKLSSILCPVMVVIYLVCCGVIIFANRENLGSVFSQIFKGAFGFGSVVGGGVGAAIRSGFSKSIFSNEAGVGTSSLAHSKSAEKCPEIQGMWGIIEVFIDTILMCTVSAIAWLSCGACDGRFGIEAAIYAFSGTFGSWGGILLAFSICAFALSTIAAWTLYGKEFFTYITKGKFAPLFPVLFIGFVILGSVMEMKKVWTLTDIFNAFALFPNLIGIICLSNQVINGLKLYIHNDR